MISNVLRLHEKLLKSVFLCLYIFYIQGLRNIDRNDVFDVKRQYFDKKVPTANTIQIQIQSLSFLTLVHIISNSIN